MAIDPYRTLGLTSAASLDDVKRAYRRLAKRYHPDAAGDEATKRFLAVQAAYEAIVGGSAGAPDRNGAAGAGARRPWEADPDRARATREAYRARGRAWGSTPGPAGASGSGPSGSGASRPGTAGPAGPTSSAPGQQGSGGSPGGTRQAGGASPGAAPSGRGAGPPRGNGPEAAGGDASGGGAGPASGRSGRRASPRRKATLTSTSYDEATREPRHPDWDGGSWYGTTSGTYWTINPREYADPRKHGPEYQARARRAAASPGADPDVPIGAGWSGARATWSGSSDDPIGATAPGRPPEDAQAEARTRGGAAASSAPASPDRTPPPGDRPLRANGAAPGAAPTGPGQAVDLPGPSPLVAGVTAGAVATIPAGAVLVLAALAGASGLVVAALVAPPVIGLAVGAATGRRRGPRRSG